MIRLGSQRIEYRERRVVKAGVGGGVEEVFCGARPKMAANGDHQRSF